MTIIVPVAYYRQHLAISIIYPHWGWRPTNCIGYGNLLSTINNLKLLRNDILTILLLHYREYSTKQYQTIQSSVVISIGGIQNPWKLRRLFYNFLFHLFAIRFDRKRRSFLSGPYAFEGETKDDARWKNHPPTHPVVSTSCARNSGTEWLSPWIDTTRAVLRCKKRVTSVVWGQGKRIA